MAEIQFNDGARIGDLQKPYIVAELNTSHFGNIDIAIKMIDAAKAIGCDCVKFQSWSADSLYTQQYYQNNPIAKRMFEKFSFSNADLKKLSQYCQKSGISFASTPYSKFEVDFLITECKVPFIKVASMDLNNYAYLDYIAKKDIPIILSTGMGDIDEIRKAVDTILSTGNEKLCILHCTSIYPANPDILQLNNILGLKEMFPTQPIGYSDHSIGTEIGCAAVALGACLLEKHFTLDSQRIGMDNQMAAEPEQMKLYIEQCQTVFRALGSRDRVLYPEERDQRCKMRRSLIFTNDLPAGATLTVEDLDAKRPGEGIPPEKYAYFIGKKLKNAVKRDTLIQLTDVCE